MSEAVYLHPSDRAQLLSALQHAGEPFIVVAGGTDVLPMIRSRHPDLNAYISLNHMEALKKIEADGEWLKIGAMVTHDQAGSHPLIREFFPALSMACHGVGSQQIRNKGTLGGSLVNASPAGDIMPCVFLFGGELEIMDKNGTIRNMPVDAFLPEGKGIQMEKTDVLIAIRLPFDKDRKSCFVKLGTRREVTIAQISICLSWVVSEQERAAGTEFEKENTYGQVRGIIGAVASRPLKIPKVELLEGSSLAAAKAKEEIAAELEQLIREIRVSAKRESKLRITESEKCYKERAVKGILYDAVQCMENF